MNWKNSATSNQFIVGQQQRRALQQREVRTCPQVRKTMREKQCDSEDAMWNGRGKRVKFVRLPSSLAQDTGKPPRPAVHRWLKSTCVRVSTTTHRSGLCTHSLPLDISFQFFCAIFCFWPGCARSLNFKVTDCLFSFVLLVADCEPRVERRRGPSSWHWSFGRSRIAAQGQGFAKPAERYGLACLVRAPLR
jgi:hypothetical protein